MLGEMRELGETSAEEHAAVGRLARDLGIGLLIVVGEGARAISDSDHTAIFTASVSEAVDVVRNNVVGTPGQRPVVLVKASRAAGLERVAEALLSDGALPVGEDVKEASP